MNSLPLVFYRSTILWVDDDALLLQIASELYNNRYNIITLNDPNECLKFFQNYDPLLSKQIFLRGYKEHEDYDSVNHMPIDFNLEALAQLRHNKNRHNEISVMVADYRMPNVTGLELFERLNYLPMKKILLTGEVYNSQAVKSFNEGIINRFIRKDDPMICEELESYIQTLTKQYFCEKTSALLSYLEVDKKLPLSDSVFIEFFNSWCNTNNVCEYYLIDKNGSFLTINDRNETRYFIVHTDSTLDFFTSINEDDENVRPFIECVTKREKIPFFGINKEAWQFESSQWGSFFYLPQIIMGREKYYWSVV